MPFCGKCVLTHAINWSSCSAQTALYNNWSLMFPLLDCNSKEIILIALVKGPQLTLWGRYSVLFHSLCTAQAKDHSNIIYQATKPSALRKLQLVQNSAACLLSNMGYHEHLMHVLCSLCWLPMEYWIKFEVLVLIIRTIHHMDPAYLKEPKEGWRLVNNSTPLAQWKFLPQG